MPKTARTKKEEKRDQYTVVLEDLRSQFKVFGEDLSSVRKKGDDTFEAVANSTDVGGSGGLGPCTVTLVNAVAAY